MPPQIKQDLNRSGWEATDFPSVCEQCLPDNPFVQMLKDDYGAECNICTRPFTHFSWKADRTTRSKQTNICLTCARLKNCCQCCMLDLSFGLPLPVRDAALNMIAPGPKSDINRQYYAQGHEKEIEEGRGAIEEAYSKTDEKARELLRRLANSEPYYKKQRRLESEGSDKKLLGWTGNSSEADSNAAAQTAGDGASVAGPIRTADNRVARRSGPYPRRPAGRGTQSAAPPTKADIEPPADPNVTSLFLTGVDDDLPEHELRKFFTPFGAIRSIVCSHRAHCAFVNYTSREAAEKAAASCQGRAVVRGCPLRVGWGKPKPLDNMENDERMKNARQGRELQRGTDRNSANSGVEREVMPNSVKAVSVALPPGKEEVQYASLKGD